MPTRNAVHSKIALQPEHPCANSVHVNLELRAQNVSNTYNSIRTFRNTHQYKGMNIFDSRKNRIRLTFANLLDRGTYTLCLWHTVWGILWAYQL